MRLVGSGPDNVPQIIVGSIRGEKGEKGDTGPATIAVGTTSTGAAGSSASVVNAGTSSAAVLDFTIPTGPPGPQGLTGASGTATITGIGDVANLSRVVSTTQLGGTGAENGANTWAKVATISAVSLADVNLNLSFSNTYMYDGGGSAGDSAMVSLSVRGNSSGAAVVGIGIFGKANSLAGFSADSFKLVGNAYGAEVAGASTVHLWVKKTTTYGKVKVLELSSSKYDAAGGVSVVYHASPAWQSAEPVGTSINLATNGVTAFGIPVVTTTGAQTLTNKTLTSPTFTGTITGAADATTVTSGKIVTGSVLSTQPEGGAGFFAMIPRLYNDLAYCTTRAGGALTITKNGVTAVLNTEYLLPDQLFAPGGSATFLLSTAPADVWVFEVTVPTGVDLTYGAHFGISMPNGYRAKDVTIEVYFNGAWSTAITSTDQASGEVWKFLSSGAFQPSKIRYTLTDFTTTQCRILSLYAVGPASPLASGSLLPRTGGALYGTTAAPPTLTATGSDASISLNLVPKGSGTVNAGGNPVGVKVAVPATATSTGIMGQWAADSSWHYVCTATNTWRRVALATW